MKYCSAQIEYVDKDLNLVPFNKVIERSGSCSIKKEPFCKKGRKLENGLSSDGLEQESENTMEVS